VTARWPALLCGGAGESADHDRHSPRFDLTARRFLVIVAFTALAGRCPRSFAADAFASPSSAGHSTLVSHSKAGTDDEWR
jgi:hypothetical protein